MKTYQNIFHATIVSLLVISGIGLILTLMLFIGVGAGMILGYPSGTWGNLWVSVFMLGLSGFFFGGIYQLSHRHFMPFIDPAGHPEEKTVGKVVQIKRDQPAAN
ncbi:hypothetical protein [Candidatus Manganitrophus noduliformans]|uniref:Uncharacterized protein n=1 Tax=Candidatus Manganitrophus noduliformans TaxID=2606439 RepID=A0A7X6DNJ5_9BACT|nr:hypothetical protein [Candidatus Manganitrophus noduliformans]NKE70188.1 hypothetical protein [Candidatus Manganitrophus noduliformans]